MPNHVHGIVWITEPDVESRPSVSRPPVGAEQLRRPQQVIGSGLIRGASQNRQLLSPYAPPTPNPAPMASLTVAQPLSAGPAQLRRGLRDGLEPGSLFVIVRTFKSGGGKAHQQRASNPRRRRLAGRQLRAHYPRRGRSPSRLRIHPGQSTKMGRRPGQPCEFPMPAVEPGPP